MIQVESGSTNALHNSQKNETYLILATGALLFGIRTAIDTGACVYEFQEVTAMSRFTKILLTGFLAAATFAPIASAQRARVIIARRLRRRILRSCVLRSGMVRLVWPGLLWPLSDTADTGMPCLAREA